MCFSVQCAHSSFKPPPHNHTPFTAPPHTHCSLSHIHSPANAHQHRHISHTHSEHSPLVHRVFNCTSYEHTHKFALWVTHSHTEIVDTTNHTTTRSPKHHHTRMVQPYILIHQQTHTNIDMLHALSCDFSPLVPRIFNCTI